MIRCDLVYKSDENEDEDVRRPHWRFKVVVGWIMNDTSRYTRTRTVLFELPNLTRIQRSHADADIQVMVM